MFNSRRLALRAKKNKIYSSQREKSPDKWRINLFILLVFIIFGAIFYQLYSLTLAGNESSAKNTEAMNQNPDALSKRGTIYFADSTNNYGNVAATNKTVYILYSNNKILSDNIGDISGKLTGITGINKAEIETKLNEKNKTYQVIYEDLNEKQAQEINNLKIKGINAVKQLERTYPFGSLASQVIGFVGFKGNDRVGQYGIEAFYDGPLGGKHANGWLDNNIASKISNLLNIFKDKKTSNNNLDNLVGVDLVLTIDKNIQEMAEKKLAETLKKWSSPSGTIIIQNPKTGDILAMTSSPSYDPNNYSDFNLMRFINPAVQQIYEPGSSFKPITMAGAINIEAVSPDTTYFDTGQVVIADRTIKNFDEKSHGTKTMREVLQLSLNTGAIFAEEKMGDDAFLNNVVAFGFGQKSGIDLSVEINGNISNLYTGRKINFATASFGQGIAVTPIQLINAYSAIANGGKLMKPKVVKEIIESDERKLVEPEIIGAPISEQTARTIQTMLVDVVEKGFDKARVKGYDIAGKTGTAQIPGPSGYSDNGEFIHNFVGFAPAYNARFTILIKIDRPKGIKFAADSLSPVFGDMAKYLIRYYNIPPTK